MHFILLYIIKI